MTTKTKKFDAVAESRKWKEAVGRKLNAMSREERIAYINSAAERFYASLKKRPAKAALAAH